ncbi:FxLYD domain-containing protein [Variovorax sp. 38R]|uniref:FxLYD domain-containing protein n=1 Tax=Variovorax sp. 38R TaxID=2774875 RepID=UPI00177AA1D9|nr:FxLYD domain-containing protein [Variovorax sp. 38R]QOF79012.1 TFIIB-type zinc ribbon-containing protein [Variovorax sp. 38R]
MSIDLQTLKCGECGSSTLRRTGLNEYTCSHCGSMSLVEDDVSDRLERVLQQVKHHAGQQIAAEQALRQKQMLRTIGFVVIGFVGVALAVQVAMLLFGSGKRSEAPSVARAIVDRTIATDGLKLSEPRQVLVGERPKLLVLARNETGRPLERPSLKLVFHDGDTRLSERSESLPIDVLMPGESAPVLVDLPSGKNVTRQDVTVEKLSEPRSAAEGPRLAFSRLRLVQQGERVRLAGRLVHAGAAGAPAFGSIEALVTLYDDAGQVIGVGRGHAPGSTLEPGGRAAIDVDLSRFGRGTAIAAWDYRIGYRTVTPSGSRTTVLSADRVIRTTGAPEVFHPDLRLSTEDLLAEDSERFDPRQLELLPLVAGRSTIQRPLFMTELVNRSTDAVAITPGAVIARFGGSTADGTTRLDELAYLYPGERFPILFEPRAVDRITQTRVEWKPMRRAALPGPRKPLEVQVTGTKAGTGSVLLNFSQRFSYKSVEVTGTVKNPGTAIAAKVRLWVSLRDRNDQLTGFKVVENLPAIAPGESVPFQVHVTQHGRDFASVATLYQTE